MSQSESNALPTWVDSLVPWLIIVGEIAFFVGAVVFGYAPGQIMGDLFQYLVLVPLVLLMPLALVVYVAAMILSRCRGA